MRTDLSAHEGARMTQTLDLVHDLVGGIKVDVEGA